VIPDKSQAGGSRTGNANRKRVGRAEEVASVIAFLASGAASCVTGTGIDLDGGASGVL
jgi:NAD(P)-dependent dehydrogenase (short-subunit alcohol dehydrogenase family)